MDTVSNKETLEQVAKMKKLYHAHVTFIEFPGHVESDGTVCVVPVPVTISSIVEMVDEFPHGITNRIDLLKDGKCLEEWSMIYDTGRPMVIGGHNDPYVENTTEIAVLHSLTPVGSKRRRL